MDAGIVVVTHEGASQQNTMYDIEAFNNTEYGAFIMDNLAEAMGEEGVYTTMVGHVTNAQILKDGSVSTLTLWDPANAGYAMASLATKILNGEKIEDGVNLGVKGYESMHFSPGSTKVLEGTGWLKITKDNVDSLGF